jgi:fused signal recognition particle receptor
MFGLLKKKLSKAIKSISEKVKEKEVEEKPVEKEIEVEKKVEEIEEAVEPIIEEQPKPEIIKAPEIITPKIELPKPEIEKPKKKSFIKKAFERVTKKIVERKLDETDLIPVLTELETDLIEADVALETSERIKANLLKELTGKEIKRGKEKDAIVEAFRKSLMDILTVPEIDLKKFAAKKKPVVLLFIGFNGSGKTTSIAKLANWLKEQKLTSVLAAADTFRAASLEQLGEHADKIGVRMIKHKYGADPAAVVYDAIMHAKAKRLDFVLADTAGRVHTNQDLMEEMKKIIRVNKPDLKILVIDSLTGNDAVLQARAFGELDVDAVIFTKVDVNEKGGAILSVTNELKKPILFLGLGQEYDDFERFDAERFVSRLLG